jgi:hypothetical protein
VSLLERTLGDEAEITTPDWLVDRDTNEPREVDIAIRMTIGSTQVLIVAECRDRNRPQDSRWIEELASKAVSVGAARAIAISSSGFTAPAITKAHRLGVEVRELRQLTASTVADAFKLDTVGVLSPDMTLLAVGVFYLPLDKPPGMIGFDEIQGRRLYLPLFTNKRSGSNCSLAEIVQDGIDLYLEEGKLFHKDIPRDGTRIQRQLTLILEDDQVAAVFSDDSSAAVVGLSVILELRYEPVELKPLIAHQYRKENESLVESVEFGPDPTSDGPNVIITFHRNVATGRWIIAQHQAGRTPRTRRFSFCEASLNDLDEPWKPWPGWGNIAETR